MATERLQIWKCEICGNIVESVHSGQGELVCCGQPMKLRSEQTADWRTEKHVPVIEKVDGGVKITVGSTLHPMAEDHYIEWIEVIVDGKEYREFLNPGDAPEAFFPIDGDNLVARDYCNVHGLWKS
ncbi:desulfoferrodoxin [bacterium]|nr:desulfoferrodoxin [bacterium]